MEWPQQHQEGFALAAAAHADREAARGAAGLSTAVAKQATELSVRLWRGERNQRHRWVRHMLTERATRIGELRADCPARVLGLLAGDVDRDLGRKWLEQAPPPRPGYAPDARLLALLRTLAAHTVSRGD